MNAIGCSPAMFRGDFAERLAAIRGAGFTHIELLSRDLFESLRGPEYSLSLLRDSGLQISCLQLIRDFEGSPRSEISLRRGVVEQMFDQLDFVGSDLLILCANTAEDSISDMDTLCEDLQRLAERAAARGKRIAYEPLGWARWMSDYRDAWQLIKRVDHPSLGLMLDSSHIGSLGLPFAPIRVIDPAKIFLVEIADLPITKIANIELSRFYRLLPGEGMLELGTFVSILNEMGYEGTYSLEVFNDHYRTLEPAVLARRALSSMQTLLAGTHGN